MNLEQLDPLDIAFTIFNTTFEAFCTVILLNGYFTKKSFAGIRSNSIFIAGCLAILWLMVWPISEILPIGAFSYVLIVGAKMLICFLLYNDFRAHLKTVVFISVISTALAIITDLLFILLAQIVIPVPLDSLKASSYIDGVLGMVSRILFYVCIVVWLMLVRKSPLDTHPMKKGGAIFVLTPLITITALYSMAITHNPTSRTTPIVIASTIGLFFLNIVVFYLFDQAIENEIANRKRLLKEQQVEIEMRNARWAIDVLVEEQKMVHDYKKHIAVIQALLREDKQDIAKDYVDDMYIDTENITIHAYSGNIAVDIVIGQMMEKCRQMDMMLELHISQIREIPLSDKEIVTVLSNILENAIEATNKVATDRIIKLKIHTDEYNLLVSVRNPVREDVEIQKNKIRSTKNSTGSHGLGLHNVADAIHAHQGFYELFCKNKIFQFTAMIPM